MGVFECMSGCDDECEVRTTTHAWSGACDNECMRDDACAEGWCVRACVCSCAYPGTIDDYKVLFEDLSEGTIVEGAALESIIVFAAPRPLT